MTMFQVNRRVQLSIKARTVGLDDAEQLELQHLDALAQLHIKERKPCQINTKRALSA